MESTAFAQNPSVSRTVCTAKSTTFFGPNYTVTVTNKSGYLCHVHLSFQWDGVHPSIPFAILTHPDNSKLIRDMKRVARHVLRSEPGFKELQVHKSTRMRDLWRKRTFNTWLHVVEDARDPDRMHATFKLLESELFAKFTGDWELRPIRHPVTGLVTGCGGQLQQDVLPKGVPTFVTRIPVLGGALRKISLRAMVRLMEDLNAALDKVMACMAKGLTTREALQELCGPMEDDEEVMEGQQQQQQGQGQAEPQKQAQQYQLALQPSSSIASFALPATLDEEAEEGDGDDGAVEVGSEA